MCKNSDTVCAKSSMTLMLIKKNVQMFEKGSDVKQCNVTETKYGSECAFSVKNHVQIACKFHDLNMDFVV